MIRQRHLIRGTIATNGRGHRKPCARRLGRPGTAREGRSDDRRQQPIEHSGPTQPRRANSDRHHRHPGPCSEVCSGGAGSYGSASQRSWTPDGSGATLPHDPRPRSVALASNSNGSLNVATATPASPVPCGDVCSAGYPGLGTPATVVRTVVPGGGFDWGDAGIGAGATIVLILIGTGGALATTNRRDRRAHQEQVSANS